MKRTSYILIEVLKKVNKISREVDRLNDELCEMVEQQQEREHKNTFASLYKKLENS